MNSGYRGDKQFIEVTDLNVIHFLLEKMLWKFHCFCETEGLKYYLAAGSFLGAVRHNGFIPWDDDIDLSMLREEYERMLMLLRQKPIKGMSLHVYPDENYIRHWTRICLDGTVVYNDGYRKKYRKSALWISIFPIDGCPSDDDEMHKCLRKRRKLRENIMLGVRSLTLRDCWRHPFLLFRSLWCRHKGCKYYLDMMIGLMKKYSVDESNKVIIGFSSGGSIMPRNVYLHRKLYNFGDHQYYGPQEYDTVLRIRYGDYMIPPPKEQQVQKHGYQLFVKRELLDTLD